MIQGFNDHKESFKSDKCVLCEIIQKIINVVVYTNKHICTRIKAKNQMNTKTSK